MKRGVATAGIDSVAVKSFGVSVLFGKGGSLKLGTFVSSVDI